MTATEYFPTSNQSNALISDVIYYLGLITHQIVLTGKGSLHQSFEKD